MTSTTMVALTELRKAVRDLSTEHAAAGTLGTTAEQPASGTRLVGADCTEALGEFFSHPLACAGFEVTDRDGHGLDRHDCILDAHDRYNRDKFRTDRAAAHRVTNLASGGVTKGRLKKKAPGNRWREAVPE